ncbi:MAG: hypothetical protein EXS03_03250 [Phycisphaerales bacterium]|nr:hypothetical protein [Phycisphaerales bacterium]
MTIPTSRAFPNFALGLRISALGAGSFLLAASAPTLRQDSNISFAGPPPAQKDSDSATGVPFGIGFNQKGGELSATALEQAALGTPTVHYHYFSPAATTLAPDPAPVDDTTNTASGFAQPTFVTPIANQTRSASWHLVAGRNDMAEGQGLATNTGGNINVGSTNYYVGHALGGTNTGQGVGDWYPMANGGTGTISGFNWGVLGGFD